MTRPHTSGRWKKTIPSIKGPLSVLALILCISVVLRLMGGPGQAIAREMGDIGASAPETSGLCTPAPDVATVLAALDEREKRIDQREKFNADRTTALARAEQDITAQLAALTEAETDLENTLALATGAAENDVTRLTAVYENMKPKEAARLFEAMAPSFAAGFLGRMRADSAAKVIQGMSPDAAYTISVILAGRHANVPNE
ncbi:hypothetical protein FQ320_11975 [Oceaniovalibus sp. ACAM 378]|nr:hypothetical protein FQ320_11975 [Oceaniovalibus sp. ACAM 378]